jgi:quercetin dioxygenase-like cupin family protein
MRGLPLSLATVVLVAAAVTACAGQPPASVVAAASVPPVVRAVLAGGGPASAPGRKLELARYTIEPATKLAAHRHPGMQLAYIEAGTLTYTVIDGRVTVHAADGGERTIGPGETGSIAVGEWIAEDETVVHFGENAGPEVVVILASSLLEDGQPAAIPVASPSASPSP